MINEIELNEEGNYLHETLMFMNLSSYDRVKWVILWLRHGKVALEAFSACKCNLAGRIKKCSEIQGFF